MQRCKSVMYLEDLILPDTDKDTSKSCVFGFPDRPPDSLPPDPIPINPPVCFPYCAGDDWPPDFPPFPSPVIPPGTTPQGAGCDVIGIINGFSYARDLNYQINKLYWFTTKLTIQSSSGFLYTVSIHKSGHIVQTNIGGLGTDEDHAIDYNSNVDQDGCNVYITQLLDYIGVPAAVIKFTFEGAIYYSPDYTHYQTLLYLSGLPHSGNQLFGSAVDLDGDPPAPSFSAQGIFGFLYSPSNYSYGESNTWTVYYETATGNFYTEPLENVTNIFVP